MATLPLTHHEILELAEPFTRLGRRVDLAASNRTERRLAFKPIEHPAGAGEAAIHETLRLDSFGTGTFRLTRMLTRTDGLQAQLQAMGPRPEELLEHLVAVEPTRSFSTGPGFVIARSYSLEAVGTRETAGHQLVMTSGLVQLDGLRLTLTLSPVRGVSAAVEVAPTGSESFDLPEDLLAVIGWDWARLIRNKDGWKSKLRLRGNFQRRSERAEAALDRAAAHLGRTLAEPPCRFHERLLAARWGVVFRRGIPLLTFVLLLIAVVSLARRGVGQGSELWILFFHVPTVLIALSFCMQELPQYEIPPLPRACTAASWRRAPPPNRA